MPDLDISPKNRTSRFTLCRRDKGHAAFCKVLLVGDRKMHSAADADHVRCLAVASSEMRHGKVIAQSRQWLDAQE